MLKEKIKKFLNSNYLVYFIIVLISLLCFIFINNTKNKFTKEDIDLNSDLSSKYVEIDLTFVDFVENISSPIFPNNICNISDYGAIKINSEVENHNVESFKKAIEDCSNKGGGTVKVPVGEWLLNGPIHFKSNINLFLEEGSIITFSSEPTDYIPVVKTRYEGMELMNFSLMIYIPDCVNVAITGKGIIQKNNNPNGWNDFKEKETEAKRRLYNMFLEDVAVENRIFGKVDDYIRTSFIQPYNSKNVLIENVTVKDGPMWTIHSLYTENLIIRNVNIETSAPNTDGIAIDSSKNVLIENNNIRSGDDAIVIKSGRDKDGWRVGKSSENIVIRNNIVEESHGAVTIGSEMSGDVRNVFVEDLIVEKSNNGLRIKTKAGRSGIIENVVFRNILIKNSDKEAIKINFRYGGEDSETTKEPEMRNIEFCDIKIINNGKKTIIRFKGFKNKVNGVLFKNIQVEGEKIFVKLKDINNINFKNVSIPFFEIENSLDIKIINDNDCPKVTQENSRVDVDCDNWFIKKFF
ncbi:MAG: glycoside hydrolase family 28 protein [Candidatus Moranbacteria bacterium]|nr:glycoside hydrolase family 28 protein [Candidatus Moranbacteria bacterium]